MHALNTAIAENRVAPDLDQSDLWMLIGVPFRFIQDDAYGFIKYAAHERCIPGLFKAYRKMLSMPNVPIGNLSTNAQNIGAEIVDRMKLYHKLIADNEEFRIDGVKLNPSTEPEDFYVKRKSYPLATNAGLQNIVERTYIRGPKENPQIEVFYTSVYKKKSAQIIPKNIEQSEIENVLIFLAKRLIEDVQNSAEPSFKLKHLAEFIQDITLLQPFNTQNETTLILILNDLLISIGETPVVFIESRIFQGFDLDSLVVKIQEAQQLYGSILKKDPRYQDMLKNILHNMLGIYSMLNIAIYSAEFELLNKLLNTANPEELNIALLNEDIIYGYEELKSPYQIAAESAQHEILYKLLEAAQLPLEFADVIQFACKPNLEESKYYISVLRNKIQNLTQENIIRIASLFKTFHFYQLHALQVAVALASSTNNQEWPFNLAVSDLSISGIHTLADLKKFLTNFPEINDQKLVGKWLFNTLHPTLYWLSESTNDFTNDELTETFVAFYADILQYETHQARVKLQHSGNIKLLIALIKYTPYFIKCFNMTFFNDFFEELDKTHPTYNEHRTELASLLFGNNEYLSRLINNEDDLIIFRKIFPEFNQTLLFTWLAQQPEKFIELIDIPEIHSATYAFKEQILLAFDFNTIMCHKAYFMFYFPMHQHILIAKLKQAPFLFRSLFINQLHNLISYLPQYKEDIFNFCLEEKLFPHMSRYIILELVKIFPEKEDAIFAELFKYEYLFIDICKSYLHRTSELFPKHKHSIFNKLINSSEYLLQNYRDLLDAFPEQDYRIQIINKILTSQGLLQQLCKSIIDIHILIVTFPELIEDAFALFYNSSLIEDMRYYDIEKILQCFPTKNEQIFLRIQQNGTIEKLLIEGIDTSMMIKLQKLFPKYADNIQIIYELILLNRSANISDLERNMRAVKANNQQIYDKLSSSGIIAEFLAQDHVAARLSQLFPEHAAHFEDVPNQDNLSPNIDREENIRPNQSPNIDQDCCRLKCRIW